MATDTNVVELGLRLLLSMGLIVAIIVVASKVLKGKATLNFGRRQSDGPKLDVLDRTQVARHASVAVVRVGGRGLIVGITEQSVSLLAEAPELIDRYEHAEAGRLGAPLSITDELARSEAGGLGDNNEALGLGDNNGLGDDTEALRTGLSMEPSAPDRTRMNFFEALRETTVRRS
jgi:flagellar biogenesis protein FliO